MEGYTRGRIRGRRPYRFQPPTASFAGLAHARARWDVQNVQNVQNVAHRAGRIGPVLTGQGGPEEISSLRGIS